jgi:outer membrane receptor protein involved in Fe transport
LQDKFQLSNSGAIIRGVELDAAGLVTNTAQAVCQILVDHTNLPPDFDISLCDSYDSLRFESDFQAWTAELQQITQVSHHTLIFGGRFQDGDIETRAMEERRIFPPSEFKSTQNVRSDLTRLSLYGYDQWQLLDTVWLTGGLSYDQLRYPRNNDAPPVSAETDTTDQISPKAGLIWQPGSSTTMRAAYTRSLGGVFYDGSVRLEPTQVAGFNQAYRSLIPESIAGNIPGSRFETADLGLEHRFASGIFFVLGAEALRSEATRDIGAFQQRFPPELPIGLPVQLTQNLEFEEHSLVASLNQLMGREWAFGARYQISEAQLKTKFPSVPTALIPPTDNRSLLHRLNLFALYNHPSGCFGEAQALWTAQSNHGYSPTLAGDDFWQLNILAGYRFPRRQAQVTIGVLNLTDQGYHLNPLNLHAELPYQRTVTASLRFSF